MWLERPDQWEKLAEHLRAAGEFGIDTETYGQPDKTSPQHRARIHCWSVGLLSSTQSPRGFRRAVGRVLPRAALEHPSLVSVLGCRDIRKWAHNAPHDRHALANEGVDIQGLEDSLQWARVAIPGRKDYGLKDMESWALGYGPRPTFMDLVCYVQGIYHPRRVRFRACLCGDVPCRARSTSSWIDSEGEWHAHDRYEMSVLHLVERPTPSRYRVTDFVPGATLAPLTWEPTKQKPIAPSWWKGQPIDRLTAFWEYSLADAVRGMELVDYLRNLKPQKLVYPWVSSLT